MKPFKEFITEGKVKVGSKDPAMARSLFAQAQSRLLDVTSLPLTETSAPYRFEGAYESLREALQAFMAQDGYKPYSHEAVVSYAELKKLLAPTELATFDRYREIRHDITYRGKKTTTEETKEAITFAQRMLKKLSHLFTQ